MNKQVTIHRPLVIAGLALFAAGTVAAFPFSIFHPASRERGPPGLKALSHKAQDFSPVFR